MTAIWIPKRLVEIGLVNVASNSTKEFIRYCENDYKHRVEIASKKIIASGCKIIMLTGPSASGKTTTAFKIKQSLEKQDVHSVVLSLDNFYKNRDDYPRLPNGLKDYENISALDITEIQRCLNKLVLTGQADFPIFDFKNEMRKYEREHIELDKGVAIIEGIHALNPLLTEMIPESSVYKIYAGLREEYSHDGQRILPTRDIRLARRMVRDNKFRGHSMKITASLWDEVCKGEDHYIKAYKPEADLLVDTSVSYEIGVLSSFITPLYGVFDKTDVGERINELSTAFSLCEPIEEKLIPSDSVLREFIGP